MGNRDNVRLSPAGESQTQMLDKRRSSYLSASERRYGLWPAGPQQRQSRHVRKFAASESQSMAFERDRSQK